jgi:hypothetical protein
MELIVLVISIFIRSSHTSPLQALVGHLQILGMVQPFMQHAFGTVEKPSKLF